LSTGPRSIPWHWMGMTVDFWKFVLSPVTSPKELRMLANVRIHLVTGRQIGRHRQRTWRYISAGFYLSVW
jgi:hypothetical protein